MKSKENHKFYQDNRKDYHNLKNKNIFKGGEIKKIYFNNKTKKIVINNNSIQNLKEFDENLHSALYFQND